MCQLVEDVLVDSLKDPFLIFNPDEGWDINKWPHALLDGLATGF